MASTSSRVGSATRERLTGNDRPTAALSPGRFRVGSRSVRRVETADFLLLATVSLWALNFTVSKYILDHGFHPLSYSAVRYSAATLIFFGITYPRERSFRINRRDFPLVALAIA